MRLTLLSLILMLGTALGQTPSPTPAPAVRPIPPPGIEVPQADKDTLKKGLEELQQLIDQARKAQAKHPQLNDLLPDIQIFHKSVDWALAGNEFFKPEDIKAAHEQIAEGKKRALAFKDGQNPWTTQKGFVVRAYQSKIDGSIQPYGMSIPANYNGAKSRLDFWLRGRAEKATELGFLDDRSKRPGPINPANVLVLHPYGRYCCANKMAGETDLFEAYAHAKKFYHFDENRLNIRGFSMGGAATWQFATHFPSFWCAATPGAGFSETPEFLKLTPEQLAATPSYQKKLWHLYNASDYALNLSNVPTIAYSGEIDGQKQAADVMSREMQKENLDLLHLIGPKTAHKIHPDSLAEIESRLTDITAKGRDRAPRNLSFTTFSLRYHQSHWITLDGLKEHWQRARVDAQIPHNLNTGIDIKTENITALTIDFAPGQCPLDLFVAPTIIIDGTSLKAGRIKSDRSFKVSLQQRDGVWQKADITSPDTTPTLSKNHGLQGPIDDAFWSSFVFVTPTGQPTHPAPGEWVTSELQRAIREWRKQFRGDAPQIADTDLKDEHIVNSNLILWGDPSSNAIIKKIADKLPVKWTEKGIVLNGKTYAKDQHVPVVIFPNPLNPARYVVLNSSFTYREEDYLNNARQVPKLPDWAVVNLSEKPDATKPGKIVDAGFFDEQWKYKSANENP
ncbi:hypothetical protein FEM03_08535 [Phragmitibacter flavus]|uniref:Peptidase S9 prolyl oligopeptidase catalytic domain-containing protein n=1 Tax=Phragmitibacter flavus TaxID=2576071 RepID=A0A5R8KF80_9BACT|nr:prolyl oligopeptidase family serine peptidase [Phragmitibacter flavus]TLD70956.1 hypothetical protein FEM03_08535 [Phragmitibacter flavus]